ncbi:hypothetical protein C7974DRAFT_404610 [Boeremia exigua]|uniref:uncharacterized protein n=1 Tax=Boeremia exigua TaxID=749465 RepID=UPI001E8D493C|nr:uncharacterized protein C7974DRAFT_404610 [Boeremia exigua]KAH6614155.1 hypothetical protein C7974DRAFT_404610 [Boeremia exigua]
MPFRIWAASQPLVFLSAPPLPPSTSLYSHITTSSSLPSCRLQRTSAHKRGMLATPSARYVPSLKTWLVYIGRGPLGTHTCLLQHHDLTDGQSSCWLVR